MNRHLHSATAALLAAAACVTVLAGAPASSAAPRAKPPKEVRQDLKAVRGITKAAVKEVRAAGVRALGRIKAITKAVKRREGIDAFRPVRLRVAKNGSDPLVAADLEGLDEITRAEVATFRVETTAAYRTASAQLADGPFAPAAPLAQQPEIVIVAAHDLARVFGEEIRTAEDRIAAGMRSLADAVCGATDGTVVATFQIGRAPPVVVTLPDADVGAPDDLPPPSVMVFDHLATNSEGRITASAGIVVESIFTAGIGAPLPVFRLTEVATGTVTEVDGAPGQTGIVFEGREPGVYVVQLGTYVNGDFAVLAEAEVCVPRPQAQPTDPGDPGDPGDGFAKCADIDATGGTYAFDFTPPGSLDAADPFFPRIIVSSDAKTLYYVELNLSNLATGTGGTVMIDFGVDGVPLKEVVTFGPGSPGTSLFSVFPPGSMGLINYASPLGFGHHLSGKIVLCPQTISGGANDASVAVDVTGPVVDLMAQDRNAVLGDVVIRLAVKRSVQVEVE